MELLELFLCCGALQPAVYSSACLQMPRASVMQRCAVRLSAAELQRIKDSRHLDAALVKQVAIKPAENSHIDVLRFLKEVQFREESRVSRENLLLEYATGAEHGAFDWSRVAGDTKSAQVAFSSLIEYAALTHNSRADPQDHEWPEVYPVCVNSDIKSPMHAQDSPHRQNDGMVRTPSEPHSLQVPSTSAINPAAPKTDLLCGTGPCAVESSELQAHRCTPAQQWCSPAVSRRGEAACDLPTHSANATLLRLQMSAAARRIQAGWRTGRKLRLSRAAVRAAWQQHTAHSPESLTGHRQVDSSMADAVSDGPCLARMVAEQAAVLLQAAARGWLARRAAARLETQYEVARRRAQARLWRRWQQAAAAQARAALCSVQCYAAAETSAHCITATRELEQRRFQEQWQGYAAQQRAHALQQPLPRGWTVLVGHHSSASAQPGAAEPGASRRSSGAVEQQGAGDSAAVAQDPPATAGAPPSDAPGRGRAAAAGPNPDALALAGAEECGDLNEGDTGNRRLAGPGPPLHFYCLRTKEAHSVHPALVELRPRLLAEFERARAEAEARGMHLQSLAERVWAAEADMQQRIMECGSSAWRGG
eukprot:jgi/Ulvmu1/967/UM102_0050.1